jgi:hypothetical protein
LTKPHYTSDRANSQGNLLAGANYDDFDKFSKAGVALFAEKYKLAR